ncbi:hypothetical protein E3U23_13160 [Erythrobacter litoralis]|uniref:FAS1-like dehydratase domain-containing protein n=1 Tax=Erythrobacter litoralis TaxID=39960 RepID=UPI0024360FFF|nr:MaoC family dehydratase N-terminal domain-containing protein [Erythrobacter litoralis]MDG6080137.1 hypothetical protein [Erythrobacter litoralis]
MTDWQDWIGREQRAADRLDQGLAARWCATFDSDAPAGATMPQGVHFCLCTPEARTGQLGEDGHPARSEAGFLPPIPLPRRMWAGSDIRFHAPLAIGATIERTSRIASVTPKSGNRGEMVFVAVEHETSADGVLAARETQNLVYLEAVAEDAPLSPPEAGGDTFDRSEWEAHHEVAPNEALLFRYSALTFNSHRIHYDAPYARAVERYRGLVVHGPLTASLLLQLAAAKYGENRLAQFRFRGLSPAIANEPLHLVMREGEDGIELGAFASDGRQITEAGAYLS